MSPNLLQAIRRFRLDDSGATASEYAMIAAMGALVLIPAVTAASIKLTSTFAAISSDAQVEASTQGAGVTGAAAFAPQPADDTSPAENLPPAPMAPEPQVHKIE